MKKKWKIRFSLPKLYAGEKWFKFTPLAISLAQGDLKSFESTLDICGFFVWQLYISHDESMGSGFNLTILGFELNIDYE